MKRNLFRSEGRRRALAVGLLLVTLAGAALTVFINVRTAEAAWWNSSWFYRKKITFNNAASGEDLVNFPVRIALTSSNINYTHTQNAGQDIRFVDSDDATPLSYEIERWDEAGTSDIWVNVPQINQGSTTDFIWMYYGNAGVGDGQTPTSVWDGNFVGVWHSAETSGTTVFDSTSNNNDGAKDSIASPSSVAGKISGAQQYVNSTLLVPDAPSLRMSDNMSISVWVNASVLNTWATILCKDENFNPNYCIQYDDSGKFQFNYGAAFTPSPTNASPTTGTWYFLSVVYDNAADQVRLYINGSLDATRAQTLSLPSDTDDLFIGNDNVNEYWMGTIDELRISNSVRSGEWMEAEYLTDNNAMNTFGAEEQYPPEPPVLTALTNSAALQPTFQLRAADTVDPTYLRYKIQVCSNSDCSSVLRIIDQTSSQTGWSGQNAQAGTAYSASAVASSSTLASHSYQAPVLSPGTQYWWRAYAIDPGGSNTWSDASAISSFITTGPPAAPTLLEPLGATVGQAPMHRLWTTDPNGDYVRYRIEICSTSNCSALVCAIDQTTSQTGWTSQDVNSATAYSAGTVFSNSQPAVHVYQSPLLSPGTQYWWRAYAIDPGGYNQWSAASSIGTFTTSSANVKLMGGTTIRGGTRVGP